MPHILKPLFRPDVLRPHLASFTLSAHIEESRAKLERWAELFVSRQADALKERELLPSFLTDFFNGILGYAGHSDRPGGYTISREQIIQVDGNFADIAMEHRMG